MSEHRIRIATRKSPLAMAAEHVAELLRRAHAGLTVEIHGASTEGDKILGTPLARSVARPVRQAWSSACWPVTPISQCAR